MQANRRLRGKQARPSPQLGEAPLHRLFQFEELSQLITSWLDQRSLCRLGLADSARHALAADPEAWRERRLELRSRALRNSSQLCKALAASPGRWALVRSLTFPQCNPSTAAVRALQAALPALRSVDLRLCTRAGSHRLLEELPRLEEVVLQGSLPRTPLLQLKTLELCGVSIDLHGEGPEDWKKLPKLVPNIEVLRVPWLEDEEDKDITQDMWEKLHEPPLGCRTGDECLHALEQMQQLKEVDLSDVYTITDAGLRILGALPKLERLLLRNMGPQVSAEGLRDLAGGPAPLRLLDLSRCLDTGCRPSAGRTTLVQADIDAFRRRRPSTEVVFC